jgi:hypothetical protein
MDVNRNRPGTASAAMNLSRCWLGAGGVAVAEPLGRGRMVVLIAGTWLVVSPAVYLAVCQMI